MVKNSATCLSLQSDTNKFGNLACPAITKSKAQGSVEGNIVRIQLYRDNGTKARFTDGRSVNLEIDLNSKTVVAKVKEDVKLIEKALTQVTLMDQFGNLNSVFNRKQIIFGLATALNVAKILGISIENPDQEGGMATLAHSFDATDDAAISPFGPFESPVQGLTRSCGMCHNNSEGVPINFIGNGSASDLDDLGKCERMEMCAPRMLYRLKMRNCMLAVKNGTITDPAKITLIEKNRSQKAPMPHEYYFSYNKITDPFTWQEKVAPEFLKFLQSLIHVDELKQSLSQKGYANAADIVNELKNNDCPTIDYAVYENFPSCVNFENRPTKSYCPEKVK